MMLNHGNKKMAAASAMTNQLAQTVQDWLTALPAVSITAEFS
ncbi:hypothetical protein ACFQ5J_05280 [Lacticaseibacillus baoqingensis]|uniref:Uncharacterized protein n=1 Tax=Lacticaseibacillus baoqingensis TaxID=2486013 RepID=A0ABW4E417_9LACO|nr:hypothetical protein [Lacticaseibacillus baoqingensis]